MLGWIRDRQDGVLATIVAVAGLIPAVADRPHVVLNCVVALLIAVAVGIRRARPTTGLLGALALGLLVTFGPAFAADTAGFVLADLVLAYTVGSLLSIRRAILAAAIGVAAFWTQDFYLGHRPNEYAFSVVLVGAPWLVGRFVRHERRLRQRLNAAVLGERQALTRAAAADERRRISADMQDVVARGLSTISHDSEYAVAQFAATPDQARASVRRVNETARRVVDELRLMLLVLRLDDDPPVEAPADLPLPHPRGMWWPQRDWGLALLVGLIGLASMIDAPRSRQLVGIAFLLILASCVSQRRRWPTAMLAVIIAVAIATTGFRIDRALDTTLLLASVIVLFTIGQSVSRRAAGLGLVVGLTGFWTLDAIAGNTATEYLASGVTAGGVWLIGVVVGREWRQRDQLARAIADQRRAAHRAATASERGRIARELHDVVAHGLSAIAVQSDAADAVFDIDPARALDLVTSIRRLAAECAAELDLLLDVLTDDENQPAGTDLIALLDAQVELGLTVHDEIDPASWAACPPEWAHAVGRITQEALTNVRRHSWARTCVVRIDPVGGELRLSIRDPGPPRVTGTPRAGHGTVGIGERVTALGGHATIGPDGTGWLVSVRLPIRAQPEATGTAVSPLPAADSQLTWTAMPT